MNLDSLRDELRRREGESLASYATRSTDTQGRVYAEPEHPFRLPFQRDRDRVIHSTAFRRLEYKTQVFVNHEGDYYRTRLTHSIEAAQITRTLCRALGLNEDLGEAVALSHDLGHTPFGHAGERVLDKLMGPYGGFEHNAQSLRIVDVLEERYPGFPGLNLSWEVREGIVKHSSEYDRPLGAAVRAGRAAGAGGADRRFRRRDRLQLARHRRRAEVRHARGARSRGGRHSGPRRATRCAAPTVRRASRSSATRRSGASSTGS